MKLIDIPARIAIPFAENAGPSYIRTIPDTTVDVGRASLDQGFPAETFITPPGGVLPAGKDFNGILNRMSAWDRWSGGAGAPALYDATFATDIGGYPQGARLLSTDGSTVWVSEVDDNETDPDGGGAADWKTAAYMDNALRVGVVEFVAYSASDSDIALVANGRSLLRADYPRLFAAIGVTWGSVDGTHFTLPDLRSAFVQGTDVAGGLTKSATDPWALGTYYNDQMQGHKHSNPTNGENAASNGIGSGGSAPISFTAPDTGTPVTDGTNGTPRTGLTTHPRGVGLVPIIYY